MYVFQVLSLFLALLLSSFSAESFQKGEEEPGDSNKLQEALDRIYRLAVWLKIRLSRLLAAAVRKFRRRTQRIAE